MLSLLQTHHAFISVFRLQNIYKTNSHNASEQEQINSFSDKKYESNFNKYFALLVDWHQIGSH